MKATVLGRILMTAALLVGAGAANAANKDKGPVPQGDDAVAKAVRHEVLMYPYYSIWDDINFRVNNGQVELMGAVNQPFKKSDIERLVQRVPGVTGVADEIKVLPLSNFDDRIRIQVARAIFSDPVFFTYRNLAISPIHIIVDNGHVTLNGIVDTEMQKQIAGMRASGAGLSFGPVVNNLQVEHPAKKS